MKNLNNENVRKCLTLIVMLIVTALCVEVVSLVTLGIGFLEFAKNLLAN